MEKKSKIGLLFLLLLFQFSYSQDSLKISADEFISIVRKYHPLAFKYRYENQIAAAEVTRARGNFDPVIAGKMGEKSIDGVRYYEQKGIELNIPTWYGIEINAGYNNLDGERLNPSDSKGGLYQLGITVPLAKNLLYDKRRAILEQAQYAVKMTEAEQTALTNDLLNNAENTYWEWVKNFEVYQLQRKAVQVNHDRLQLTKKTYEYGERPAIDTVEAASQLQNFILEEKEALLNFIKSTQDLQLYLWKENKEIYEISQLLYPADKLDRHESYSHFDFLIQEIQSRQLDNHPAIQYYTEKQKILESEKKLKWQSFLPKLDFSYNFFNKENYKAEYLPLFETNFQYGLKLEIPIFQREARGNYEIAKFKILQNQQDIRWKSQDIRLKIETYKNEILNYHSQIDIAEKNLENYQKLLNAEEIKYTNGESSFFFINSRETKMIEAREKFINLKAKFIKSYTKLKWMNENFK